jgi:hypothetical protein
MSEAKKSLSPGEDTLPGLGAALAELAADPSVVKAIGWRGTRAYLISAQLWQEIMGTGLFEISDYEEMA